MKKKRITYFALLFVGLMLIACGGGEETSSQPAEGVQPSLRVGILSIDDSLPIALAHEEGRYADAGLDVEVFRFKSSSDQSQAMEAGELDIVMNDMIVQGLMKKGGTDTKILSYAFGATPQEGRFMVLGNPSGDLRTLEDLSGSQVAISTNTMMEFLMDSYLDHFDLSKEEVEYINMPNLILRMESLLAGEDIDAAILPDPLASFAASQGAPILLDDTTLDANYSQSVYLVRQELLDEAPETLASFLDVTFGMMESINAYPDDYRAYALDFAKVPESLQADYPMPSYSPGSQPDEEQLKQVIQWLYDKGLIDELYSYSDMVATDLMASDA